MRLEVLDALAGITLNQDQEDYLDLLSDLAAGYKDKTVEMPKVPVTEVLKGLIEESNMTQTGLAEVLGIDNALVTKILKGEREITVDLARTLARQFNVDASLFKDMGIADIFVDLVASAMTRHYAHPNLNRRGVPENRRNSGRGTAAPVE